MTAGERAGDWASNGGDMIGNNTGVGVVSSVWGNSILVTMPFSFVFVLTLVLRVVLRLVLRLELTLVLTSALSFLG